MSAADDNNNSSKCAACGERGDGLKTCTACKLVKYCNATCQKAHRPKHKKECKKRAAELHDEALFKEPPPREECGICSLPLPVVQEGKTYYSCCGKTICGGCMYADVTENNRFLCPFCRTPHHTSNGELIERLSKRVQASDAGAMNMLGYHYCQGDIGLPQNHDKAMELWLRAGQLGHSKAYYNLANSYFDGDGVERDLKKAKYYWELAALGGEVIARHNLGTFEAQNGNMRRAVKHWMIAAGAGDDKSLEKVREFKRIGLASKDEFEKAVRAHKEAKDEMKSDQREAAAAIIAARHQN